MTTPKAQYSDNVIRMMRIRRLCCLLLVLCFFISLVSTVRATTESLNIEAGKELVSKINVSPEDRVQLTFVTTGQASSNLSFSIMFPNSTFVNLGELDQYSTRFTSHVQGTCELHFDNTNSSESAFVALNYNVEHYILGIPEMIFVLAAIAVLLMIAVSGYIIMGKYSNF
jgi:hypothetical protein